MRRVFNFFEELFAPGRRHAAEEQKRLELTRVDLGVGDPGHGPIDLASGKVIVRASGTGADRSPGTGGGPEAGGGTPSGQDRAANAPDEASGPDASSAPGAVPVRRWKVLPDARSQRAGPDASPQEDGGGRGAAP
ncbi:DUF6191 domain-containing protein [Streptomyces sp. NPDC088178]|uniref:DUF6191 domain-containing protein n=1 Tax=Streptomyces sp. NPDC088178 TaxID=3365836 RepID=UPI00380BC2CE